MEIAVAVLSIAGTVTLGAMSPGASFIMAARTALAVSRTAHRSEKRGISMALGHPANAARGWPRATRSAFRRMVDVATPQSSS